MERGERHEAEEGKLQDRKEKGMGGIMKEQRERKKDENSCEGK